MTSDNSTGNNSTADKGTAGGHGQPGPEREQPGPEREQPGPEREQPGPERKPTPDELGIDPDGCAWTRSGDGDGSIEIAFPVSDRWARGDWVLMRIVGDAAGRVLVFDRNEWVCFLDGARNGEFDDAAETLQLS